MELEVPELVTAELWDGAPAKLRGGRCSACEFVFFPPYSYGCELPVSLRPSGGVRGAAAAAEGQVRCRTYLITFDNTQ